MASPFADRMSKVHKSFIREILKVTEDPGIISFAGGLPNPKFFPVKELARAAQKVLDECGQAALQYSTTEGFLPLREIIAQRYAEKGLRVGAEDILITGGSQQGLDLLGKAFLNKGDRIIVEDPTYLAAIQSFGMFEPTFQTVPLQEDGVDVDALTGALSCSGSGGPAKLFYAVPNFQNPTGVSYSEDKRRQVADALLEGRERATYFIEDDPYGELRFMGRPAPSMWHFLEDRAILLGSFSKVMSPGMRLGWISACPEVMEKLVIAKQASDLHTNYLSQRIAHQYLVDNDVNRHIELIRAEYGRQRETMVRMIEETFPPGVRYTRPEGGMFLWITLPEKLSSLELFNRAIKNNVAFVPGQAFYANGGGENTMRLNFSNSDDERIVEGMSRLARAIKEMMA
ncbi:MAG: PLP-dependent aminotransferase family protein [Methanosarcinales archaeon]|nr:PLP-dependent aminotransferase family protein [Methanosarcinales archaeon]